MANEMLIIPPGKATGCLPRKTKFGDCCALLSDVIETIPQDQWVGLIGQVSLRPRVRQILDQDGVGSCATESTTGAGMILRDLQNQPFVLLNPWFIYHTTSGGRDSGSSIDENLVFARVKGIAPESVWPRSKGWQATPNAEAVAAALRYRIVEFFDIGRTAEFATALLLGYPVVYGSNGHSKVATRLLTPTSFEYANSWAPSWGDRGFGTEGLASVNWGYGAFAARTMSRNPDEPLPPAPQPQEVT